MGYQPMKLNADGFAICCHCLVALGREDGRSRYCSRRCRDEAANAKQKAKRAWYSKAARKAELESYRKTGVDHGEPEGVLVDRFAIEKAAPVRPWRASSLAAAGEKSAAADAMYRDGLVML